MNPAAERERAFFDRLAPEWDAKVPVPESFECFPRWRAALAASGALVGGGPLLEVGCGTGRLLPFLRDLAGGEESLVGFDVSPEMLARAGERARQARASLCQGDVLRMPFADGAFACVVAANTFPHFVPRPEALASLRRVLRPGGLLQVVHFRGRVHINGVHAQHEDVRKHRLPPAEFLAGEMRDAGFRAEALADEDEFYLVQGTRA